jgi:hypothetical protein
MAQRARRRAGIILGLKNKRLRLDASSAAAHEEARPRSFIPNPHFADFGERESGLRAFRKNSRPYLYGDQQPVL